jgi:hypothetical protein
MAQSLAPLNFDCLPGPRLENAKFWRPKIVADLRAPPGSTLKAEFHKRIQLKIGRVKPHRVVSGASDFRNDSWAQALKNISALSGCLYRAAEEMECRPRNFTKDA